MGTLLSFVLQVLLTVLVANHSMAEEDESKTSKSFDNVDYPRHLSAEMDTMTSFFMPGDSQFSAHKTSKRSAYSNYHEIRADDLILRSISSYCKTFNSDPDISIHLKESFTEKDHISERDISGQTPYKGHRDQNRLGDIDVIPLSVSMEKEGDQRWFLWDIAHSRDVKITKFDYDGIQEVLLNASHSDCQSTLVISKARFVLPKSNEQHNHESPLYFRVNSLEGDQAVTISIPRNYLPNKREVTSNIDTPYFKLFPPPSSTGPSRNRSVVLDQIKGMSFEVEINSFRYAFGPILRLDMILWDSNSGELFRSNALMTKNDKPEIGIVKDIAYDIHNTEDKNGIDGTEMRLFNVTSMTISPTDYGEIWRPRYSRIKIDINPIPGGHRHLIGKITITDHVRGDVYRRYIGSFFEVTIPLISQQEQDHEMEAFNNLIYFEERTRFYCNEDGNKEDIVFYRGRRNNCKIHCQAYGTDLSFIYINKQTPTNRTKDFELGWYVLSDRASAILDVGPWGNGEVAGSYECTVVTKTGEKRTQTIELLGYS